METQTKSLAAVNAEIVRKGYEAFNHADINTLSQLFDANVSWHTPGKSHLAGTVKGLDATMGQFGRYGAETHGTFKANLEQLFTTEKGDVISVHRNSGERNGKKLDTLCCIIFTMKDNKVIDGREIFYDLYAWDAFWS